MFDKSIQRKIENLFSVDYDNVTQLYNNAQALLLLLRVISASLLNVKNLWDNSFSEELEAVVGNGDLVNHATKRWWKMAQAFFLAYSIFMELPLSTLSLLSMPDGQGGTVQPFNVYDPEVLGNLANKSLKQVAYRAPETQIEGESV